MYSLAQKQAQHVKGFPLIDSNLHILLQIAP